MRRISLLGLLLCIILLWPRQPAAAQDNGWSAPWEVSDTSEDAKYGRLAWFPDIAVGPDDSVHVIWGGGINVNQTSIDLLFYRQLRDGKWSKPNDIADTGSGGYTVRNSIAIGRDGRLHVLMRTGTKIKHFSAPWDKGWSAQSWNEPRPVSGSSSAYYTALAIDSQGTLHALWSEAVPADPRKPNKVCPFCSDMFYRRSTDGGNIWSAPLDLSNTVDGENRPQIKIDQQDRIHAVWDQGVDWYAGKGQPKIGIYRRSDDGGITWSAPISLELPGDTIQQTALALDANNNPLVVYRSIKTNKIFFQRSDDGGEHWGTPNAIPGVEARDLNDNNLDTYSMVTDSAGRTHLLMVGFIANTVGDRGSPMLMHLSWDGTSWSAPEVIMKNDLYPEWPHIVLANGNHLHAVWFTRHKADMYGSERGAHYQVWYSEKTMDIAAATALPLFTPTPTHLPTATPKPADPTPTLQPMIGRAPPPSHSPQWEVFGLLNIGVALLPLIGLFALIGAMTLRARRRSS